VNLLNRFSLFLAAISLFESRAAAADSLNLSGTKLYEFHSLKFTIIEITKKLRFSMLAHLSLVEVNQAI